MLRNLELTVIPTIDGALEIILKKLEKSLLKEKKINSLEDGKRNQEQFFFT